AISVDIGRQNTESDRIPSFVDRVEIAEIQTGPVVIHRTAENAARVFKSRRQAEPPAGIEHRPIQMVRREAGRQRMSVKIRKVRSGLRGKEVLIRLSLHRPKEI